jgi:hypothetical protein
MPIHGARNRVVQGASAGASPKISLFDPQYFIIGPGFLTIEGGFPPKISPQTPISSLSAGQSTVIKQQSSTESLNFLNL